MQKMKVAVVTEAQGPLQIVEREVPQPGAGQVLAKVQACGICHGDAFTKEARRRGVPAHVSGHAAFAWC